MVVAWVREAAGEMGPRVAPEVNTQRNHAAGSERL